MFARFVSQISSLKHLLKDAGELWENFCKLQEMERVQILENLQGKIQDRWKYVEVSYRNFLKYFEDLYTGCPITKMFQAKEHRISLIIEATRQETKKKVVEDNVTRMFRILDEVKLRYPSFSVII